MYVHDSRFTVFCCGLVPTLQWRHNELDSVSKHQLLDCLLNRLFRRRSEKTSKLRVTGLCAGNSPGTGEFPAQMASNAKKVSNWWRHHDIIQDCFINKWTTFRLPNYRWSNSTIPVSNVSRPNVGTTLVLSSRRFANVGLTNIAVWKMGKFITWVHHSISL